MFDPSIAHQYYRTAQQEPAIADRDSDLAPAGPRPHHPRIRRIGPELLHERSTIQGRTHAPEIHTGDRGVRRPDRWRRAHVIRVRRITIRSFRPERPASRFHVRARRDPGGGWGDPSSRSNPAASWTPRSSVGGNLANGSAQFFTVRGTTGFVPQGGNFRWLRNPAGSTPVSTSVTTTQTAGAGLLIGSANRSPTRTSRPTTRGLGMTVGANFALRAPGPEPSLVIGHYGGPTDLIIDVTGYYAPQLAGFVEQDGTLTYSSGRITAVSHPSTGNYDILSDRNVPVSFQVTPYGYNWVTAVGRVGTTKRMSTFTTRLRPSISTTRHSTSWRSAERSPLTNAIGAPSPGEADPGLISEMPRGNTASVPAM